MSEVKTNKISSVSTNGDITLDPDGTGNTIVASGNVGIGETSPLGTLHVRTSDASITSVNANADDLIVENNGNCGITIASSTSGQGNINFIDSGDTNIGRIQYTHSDNNMIFRANDTEAMRIDTSGRVGLGGTGLALSPSAMITMESSEPPLKMYRTVTNAAFTCIELRSDSGSTNRHVFSVLADGDVLNVNNSYGSLSDASLKENVSAAASQWDDIKAVQVKKYSMIADNVDAANRLGVIAQDLEASGMTGLVKETEDGTKTVKYSVLYMKAFKALQEAMDRIETLETEMTALKARVTALEDA